MLVKNWMKRDFLTLSSNDSIIKAQELFEKNPDRRYIVIIDDGKLRGILTRRDVLFAGTFVASSQDPYEMEFFVNKVKVKDVMKRMPITINQEKPLEEAIKIGIEKNFNFLPVVDDGKVVGTISSKQLVEMLFNIIGMNKDFLDTIVLENANFGEEHFKKLMIIFIENSLLIWSMFFIGDQNVKGYRLVLKAKIPDRNSFIKSVNSLGYEIKELEARNIWLIKND